MPNFILQRGAITPGKPKIKLPGRKTVRQEPIRVRMLVLAKALEVF